MFGCCYSVCTVCSAEAASWRTISYSRACEKNKENIESVASQWIESLTQCKRMCFFNSNCIAIDWFKKAKWCNLFEQACTKPLEDKNGASSFMLLHGGDTSHSRHAGA